MMKLEHTIGEEVAFINSNLGMTPLNSLPDSSGALATEETEECLSLKNLSLELADPYDEILKRSCEEAIASYLASITDPQEEIAENSRDVLDVHAQHSLEELQQHVITTLERALLSEHRVRVINECRQPCTCCYVIPTYIQEQIHQMNLIRQETIGKEELVINQAMTTEHPAQLLEAHHHKHEPHIEVYTVNHSKNMYDLPGELVLSNKSHKHSSDPVAKKALEGAQKVYDFWMKNYDLHSFDGKGGDIISTVHFGENFDNAFWNGTQMVYGDGDDVIQNLLELSIIGHEFGHAVTGDRLNYQGEAGALNEHLSDVWGSLVLQYQKQQTVHQASWLIGEGVLKIGNQTFPIRSMKAPGTAYDTLIGKDLQPDHYSKIYQGSDDNGGVHINSGIPNKAFYLFAQAQGGYAWKKSGLLWYLTMKNSSLVKPDCSMAQFAQATLYTAMTQFPTDYKMHKDLTTAWNAVGVI